MFKGCTNHPAPGERFCSAHKDHKSPAVTPDKISRESLDKLNKQHSNIEKFLSTGLDRDNIFFVEGKMKLCDHYYICLLEGILNKKTDKGVEMYLVKWENYDHPTWEPTQNIPEFITNFYEKTGSSDIFSCQS